MRTNRIANTDLQPSVICLGTSGYGSEIERETAYRLMDLYTERGGNFLDSANIYDDWAGLGKSLSEKTVGAWLKERGCRDRIVLATKGAHPDLAAMDRSRLSRADILHDLQDSLSNLQTDYIDLYWLHRDDPRVAVEGIVDVLNEQVRAGTIRAFGCSNWTTRRIRAANEYASGSGLLGFAANQPLWNLAVLNPGALEGSTVAAMDDEMAAYHAAANLAAVPFSSQANGFFGGRYVRGQSPEKGGRSAIVAAMYANEASFDRLDRAIRLAEELDTTPTRIALAYLTAHSFPVFPIIGVSKSDYLLDSCAAADLRLSPKQARWLETGEAQ
ncbi:aldo/keto reductase [Paenibacillus sacheonensis]|uniref:Aldo/keto reductase n=1 Tax=Paenibacillus sacheonensis TaxID=742054 RepID=A0A7X5BWK4_9BACL|nr:aldo/keto reductase [Paenibacillus sacheonensis]MBM7565536.1 aryl-alcohol dehydrogenase-like predicted oxidoreductase [Paenibacillus sacheonensis]NBC69543.1 aldo/keto reductase [Paenibacillus sacheonensis]